MARVYGLADQAINQSGRQGFFSRSAVVCPFSLGLSPGSPLPRGAGLGFLSSIAVRCPDAEGQVRQNFWKNYYIRRFVDKFIEIYATIAFARQFGYKKRKLSGVKHPKTVF
jgi:hypothetical protein